jgi:hypothetical protein
MQHKMQLERLFSFTNHQRLVETSTWQHKKAGRARVGEALRFAIKRNELAARELRALRSSHKMAAAKAVSEMAIAMWFRRTIRCLNVDLGLLYAASKLADSQSLSAGKVLPGVVDGWRGRMLFVAKAARDVGTLYDRTFKSTRIISNLLTEERFLEKLNDRALAIFS